MGGRCASAPAVQFPYRLYRQLRQTGGELIKYNKRWFARIGAAKPHGAFDSASIIWLASGEAQRDRAGSKETRIRGKGSNFHRGLDCSLKSPLTPLGFGRGKRLPCGTPR